MANEERSSSAPRSRRFFWWFLGIQLLPLLGVPLFPSIISVWMLITLANSCALAFNLARHVGRPPDGHQGRDRAFLFAVSGAFAIMALMWAVKLAVKVYQSGSLNL